MDDLERELRSALRSVTEPPPAGLLQAVLRRHRRRRRRVGAGCVAAVAAVALVTPAVTQALRPARSGPAPGPSTGSQSVPAPWPTVTAAPGTVFTGCGTDDPGGGLGSRWRTGAVQAGPLWFLNGGHSDGRLRLYVVIAVITGTRPGSAVVVRVAPPGRPYLRFLFGPRDSLSAGTRYSLRSGEAGVTFQACDAPQGFADLSYPYTYYYGGMLLAGRRCVPVNVWPPGAASPLSVRLGSCPGWGTRLPRG